MFLSISGTHYYSVSYVHMYTIIITVSQHRTTAKLAIYQTLRYCSWLNNPSIVAGIGAGLKVHAAN